MDYLLWPSKTKQLTVLQLGKGWEKKMEGCFEGQENHECSGKTQ